MFPEKLLRTYGAVEKKYTPNQPIFIKGKSAQFLYQILSGKVYLFNLSEQGKVFIQGVFTNNETFGEPPLLGGFLYPINATADKLTRVLCISLINLKELFKEHPEYLFLLTQKLALRLGYKSKKLNEISSSSPLIRVFSLLQHYKLQSGIVQDYSFPLTRKEIGMLTGLRTETVIRVVKKLEREQKLQIKKGKIIV